jgi:CRP-like cAMP-binding protein
MEPSARAALLIRAGFNLSTDDAELLVANFHDRDLGAGDYLFHEGEPGNALFLAHAERAPGIGLALAELCARRARDLSQWISTAVFTSLEARLAGALLTLPAASSDEEIVLRITQQALGDRLGVSRETVNKWLRSWERDEIVRLGRSAITLLDPKRLEALARS